MRKVTVLIQRHQRAVVIPGPSEKQDKNDIGVPGCDRSLATGSTIRGILGIDHFDMVLSSPAFRACDTIVHTVKGVTGFFPAVQTEWEFGDGSMTSNPVAKEEMAQAKAAYEADKSHTIEWHIMNDPELTHKLYQRGKKAAINLTRILDENAEAEIVALGTHGAGICEPLCGFFSSLKSNHMPEFSPGDFALIPLYHNTGGWRLETDDPIRYFHVVDLDMEGGEVEIQEVPFDADAARQRKVLDSIE